MPPRERKWTEANRAVIVANVKANGNVAGAAREIGIRTKLVEQWIAKGRREKSGPYFDFVKAIEKAKKEYQRQPLTREEFEKHLSRAVRNGSVQAMKLWHEINRKGADDENKDPADPFEDLDELAPRRSKRSQTAKAKHG